MRFKKVIKIILSVFLVLVILFTLIYYQDAFAQRFDSIPNNVKISGEIIDLRIENGLLYLHEKQLPNGLFPCYISDVGPTLIFAEPQTVAFDSGLIFHTLNLVDGENTNEIVRQMKYNLTAFMNQNMEPHNVWRFYGKDQVGIPWRYRIPPDLDDTSVIFSGLVESGVNVSNETLDYMLEYKKPDGTFYTWMNSEEFLKPSDQSYDYYKINDFDANVNANVLYAFSLRNRTQDGIITYLNRMIKNKSFLNGSLYYKSPYVFIYLVTKAYSEGNIKELEPSMAILKDFLLKNQDYDGGWGNDMHTSLATVSLINMGYEGKSLEKAIEKIINRQKKDGSWSSYAFYSGPDIPISDTVYYQGSGELTTSFSLEALIKYNKMIHVSYFREDI